MKITPNLHPKKYLLKKTLLFCICAQGKVIPKNPYHKLTEIHTLLVHLKKKNQMYMVKCR